MDNHNGKVTIASEHVVCDECERIDGVKSSLWLMVLKLPVLRAGVMVSCGVGLRCLRCADAGRRSEYPVSFNWLPGMTGVDLGGL